MREPPGDRNHSRPSVKPFATRKNIPGLASEIKTEKTRESCGGGGSTRLLREKDEGRIFRIGMGKEEGG
jgi:hypothetical protein